MPLLASVSKIDGLTISSIEISSVVPAMLPEEAYMRRTLSCVLNKPWVRRKRAIAYSCRLSSMAHLPIWKMAEVKVDSLFSGNWTQRSSTDLRSVSADW